MAAATGEHEPSPDEPAVPAGETVSATDRTNVPWPLAVMSAAAIGALLSGLVAFVWGCVSLAQFGWRLGRVGFFTNWVIVAAFTGRSFSALTVLVLVTAAVGALAWAAGALIYRQHAHTSRARQGQP
jgi:hypothetical protein